MRKFILYDCILDRSEEISFIFSFKPTYLKDQKFISTFVFILYLMFLRQKRFFEYFDLCLKMNRFSCLRPLLLSLVKNDGRFYQLFSLKFCPFPERVNFTNHLAQGADVQGNRVWHKSCH